MSGYRGFAMTLQLALEREEARRVGDYTAADAIRDTLSEEGTRFDDKQHIFITASGLQGSYSLSGGVSFEEMQYMCLDREEARRDGDYVDADEIRDRLHGLGVTVDDKAHIFFIRDGRHGSFNLRTVPPLTSKNGQAPPLPPPAVALPPPDCGRVVQRRMSYNDPRPPPPFGPPPPSSVAMRRPPAPSTVARVVPNGHISSVHTSPLTSSKRSAGSARTNHGTQFAGYFDALCCMRDREKVRKSGDYASADRMRAEQEELGVDVHDRSHTFRYRGMEGSYNLQEGLGSQEVHYIALEREEARRNGDYETSDGLRTFLTQHDVIVEDKTHTFKMPDGTVGSYNLQSWTPCFEAGGHKRRRL